MSLIVTAAEMRALDRETIDVVGVPGVVLMDAAGRGVADVVASLAAGSSIVVYAAAGNNGGDGYVAARHLHNRGLAVEVIRCAPADKIRGDARVHYDACARSGVPIHGGEDAASLARALERTAGAKLIVDALLGTGLDRPVEGHLAHVIDQLNRLDGVKVAVDLPSGLDSDRGVPLGACVRADHTVTFAFAKRGLVVAPGFTFAGALHVIDIGIPRALAVARGVRGELLEPSVVALLPPLDPLAHKGTRGHLLVVAGSTGKSGAALLAGRAALRSGAGLVTVCSPEPTRAALDGRVPELMTAGYHWDPPSPLDQAWRAIEPLLDGKRAVACGPGVPTDEEFRALVGRLCAAARDRGLGLVLDADALNHLAHDPALLERPRADATVLTPHPGEAARLLGCSTKDVQADRPKSALGLAQKFGVVVALKGARTIVAAPDGRLAVSPTGNPGLGTGGTGDVLTGCIGALFAQGLDAFTAATIGVYVHGDAGDRAARARGVRGITASDVADELPRALTGRARE